MVKFKRTTHDGLVVLLEALRSCLVEFVVPPARHSAVDDNLGDVSADYGDAHENLVGK